MASATSVSLVERARVLGRASQDYMSGRLSIDEYDAIRQRYRLDYVAMARYLAEIRRRAPAEHPPKSA